MAKLRLYVWTGFCSAYFDGLAVAIAETVDEAKLLVQAAHRPQPVWDWGTLSIHDIEKCAYCVTHEEGLAVFRTTTDDVKGRDSTTLNK